MESYFKGIKMRVAVFRSGAFGDLMFASSVFKAYKDLGWHVTLIAALPSSIIVDNDPNIDEIIQHDTTIKQEDLCEYWSKIAKNYDRFINLSGSIECELLQLPGQPTFHYPLSVRKELYDRNYLQHTHMLSQMPYEPNIKFYPTTGEIWDSWIVRRTIHQPKILAWVISGSSIHKLNPHINTFVANILKIADVEVVLIGAPEQNAFADGLKNVEGVTLLTHLSVRDQYTFVQQHADVIIGPETGIMVAMSQEPMKKIVLLSHSTINMLTRDWVNTTSIEAPIEKLPCGGCCKYKLSESDDVMKYEDTQYACCQVLQPMHLAFESAGQTLTEKR